MANQIKCPSCHLFLLGHPAKGCLDAWIAEYIMKWERIEDIEQTDALLSKAKSRRSSKLIGPKQQSEDPYFSTDIVAAWTIVELLRLSPGCRWHIYSSEGEWVVQISQNQKELETRAHTVMLGVCYTALQWVINN